MGKKILVLGSSNVDLILRLPRFHLPGETVQAETSVTTFGGKGANQAVAAKLLGGTVTLLTKLGRDGYGQTYRRFLLQKGLDRRGLLQDAKRPTGMALIELNPRGENRIIVSPGANGSLSPKDLQGLPQLWRGIRVFVTQLEIPPATVKNALQMAKRQGALTLLNPSPPLPLPCALLSNVDFLVPNEWEAQSLTGLKMAHGLPRMAERFLSQGVKNVVITLGPKGVFFKNKIEEFWIKAFRVPAIDTTAAGDAFLGALACGLAENKPLREALRWANGAGALATTRLGAQPSLPSRKDLEIFLSKREQA